MPEPLSPKQEQVLNFLKTEIRRKGYPPTVREICDAVSLSSTSTVHSHLDALERKGYIRRSPTKNRSIEIIDKAFYGFNDKIIGIPIVSTVTSGMDLWMQSNIQGTFPAPADLIPNGSKAFMFMVTDDSMSGAGIHRGDMAVAVEQMTAETGNLVLAQIDKTVLLRTYHAEMSFGRVRLEPANAAYSPVIVANPLIIGKIAALYRKY
jgi:repressor LexA